MNQGALWPRGPYIALYPWPPDSNHGQVNIPRKFQDSSSHSWDTVVTRSIRTNEWMDKRGGQTPRKHNTFTETFSRWRHKNYSQDNKLIWVNGLRKCPNKCRVSIKRQASRSTVWINAGSPINAGSLIDDMNEFDRPCRKISLLL